MSNKVVAAIENMDDDLFTLMENSYLKWKIRKIRIRHCKMKTVW
jgi:hypothetical protein